MKRRTEAQFWHVVGAVIGVGGAGLVAYAYAAYGLAPIVVQALELALAGSFMILAGGAAFLAGRALHVEETILTPLEAGLWKALAGVCICGGAALVVVAKVHHGVLLVDRMAMALAGAFTVMFGVVCLLGERVMIHMHEVLVVQRKPEDKAKAAGAS